MDRGPKLDAERFGARDHFLRIGNVGRRDLVHHLGGCVAQHALGADVEDLDDALGVGGNTREVGAVENRALQGPFLEQCLFRLFARGDVVKATDCRRDFSELVLHWTNIDDDGDPRAVRPLDEHFRVAHLGCFATHDIGHEALLVRHKTAIRTE